MTKACPTSCQVCDKGQQDSGQAVSGAQPSLSVQLGWGSTSPPSLVKQVHQPLTHGTWEHPVMPALQGPGPGGGGGEGDAVNEMCLI